MSCVHPEGKIAYVHIAKTGGTSIEKILKSIGWNGLKRPPFSKVHHVGFHRIKNVYAELERAVTIVRNPVDRAISAYRHFIKLTRDQCTNNDCIREQTWLKQLEEGFVPWITEHSHYVKRWQGIHRPQLFFIREGGRSHSSSVDFSHTKVFDYSDRKSFWQYTLGFIPEEPHIHKFDIDPVVLSASEREEIMKKFFKTDYNIWGEQFDWR